VGVSSLLLRLAERCGDFEFEKCSVPLTSLAGRGVTDCVVVRLSFSECDLVDEAPERDCDGEFVSNVPLCGVVSVGDGVITVGDAASVSERERFVVGVSTVAVASGDSVGDLETLSSLDKVELIDVERDTDCDTERLRWSSEFVLEVDVVRV
jgi:hypothetical protein